MGRCKLKSLPSLVEMPDGTEILFDRWSPSEKEEYGQRMLEELGAQLDCYDKRQKKQQSG